MTVSDRSAFSNRRRLLGGLAAIGIAAPLGWLYRRSSASGRPSPQLGPLVPDPDGVLDLPRGLTYRVLQRTGEPMDDGQPLPGKPDGMGCFTGPDDSWILMRNHELSPGLLGGEGARGRPEAFDPNMPGGVTRLVVGRGDLGVRSSHLVLTGTDRNCAGGVSPWGWLSCEESVAEGHGYVFACPTDVERLVPPQPVVGYGRFRHEAAAIVPDTHICYLTEDRPDGCLYRFVPDDPARPFEGRLQAMRIAGQPRFDTGQLATPGQSLALDWVDLDETDPHEDSLRGTAQSLGAAIVRRGEGLIYDANVVYVCATSGGPESAGQVFAVVADGGRLKLLAVSTDEATLDHPDNVCVAPWGDVIVAEDGLGSNALRGITPDGAIYDLARNALSNSELTGVCFSPAGDIMFVNLQHDGLTLAIVGDFPT